LMGHAPEQPPPSVAAATEGGKFQSTP
jgi:hypothetical protein